MDRRSSDKQPPQAASALCKHFALLLAAHLLQVTFVGLRCCATCALLQNRYAGFDLWSSSFLLGIACKHPLHSLRASVFFYGVSALLRELPCAGGTAVLRGEL